MTKTPTMILKYNVNFFIDGKTTVRNTIFICFRIFNQCHFICHVYFRHKVAMPLLLNLDFFKLWLTQREIENGRHVKRTNPFFKIKFWLRKCRRYLTLFTVLNHFFFQGRKHDFVYRNYSGESACEWATTAGARATRGV